LSGRTYDPGVAVETTEIHRLTLDEYHGMAASGVFDDARVELLDGYMVDLPVRSPAHEDAVAWLVDRLHPAVDQTRFQVRIGAALTIGRSEPEPDIFVVARDAPRPHHPGTATLVVEVSHSSLRRDLRVKPRIYAEAAIPRYWVVDLDHGRAVVHTAPGPQGYDRVEAVGPDGSLEAPELGISIPLAELLAAAG
jgi:Uma2 family endonuclease